MLILGIESSCDETALSIVRDGVEILAASREFQDEIHAPFGGVVPEFAARHHAEKISILFKRTLEKANIEADKIDAIGVTNGPGLVGSLLVGFMFARGLSIGLSKPLIPVNHILAHLYMPSMIFPKEILYPHYAILISGGHTFLIRADSILDYEILAMTRDDAIGEAFDKIAFFMGLGYPGGKAIDKRALNGNCDRIAFPITRFKEDTLDFSFSGLKTATLEMIRSKKYDGQEKDFLASFQKAAFDIVLNSVNKLNKEKPLGQIVFGGGVAANSFLRDYAHSKIKDKGVKLFFPPLEYCTDNGAMVAGLAYHLWRSGKEFKDQDVFSRSDFRKTY